MSTPTRRHFLSTTAAGIAASTLAAPAISRAAGANERVRVATIGCGNQGKGHIASLTTLDNVELAYVCDVDQKRLAEAVSASGGAEGVGDFRRILDDNTIDGVTIAVPDHWHAPAALMALDAGKHVYVEKPCSHNIREGRLLLDAARKHNKAVQHGTQARSNAGTIEAIQLLRDGLIGDVLIAKCWNWQRRKDIGHMQPSDPPAGVDYDTWVGPAEWMPYQANRFHYDWHWWHNFGCGDFGNDGIHEFDYALWGLGPATHPTTVSAVGGKYYFDDDQQFPDTQQIVFEYPGEGKVGDRRMLIFEMRLWSTTYPFNVDSGVEFFGTNGRMFISKRGKFEVLGERNERKDVKLEHDTKAQVVDHQRNWIDCVKSGKRPNADIEIAHRSVTAMHLGNISTRVGRTLQFDGAKEQVIGDDEANALVSREYRQGGHWGVPTSA